MSQLENPMKRTNGWRSLSLAVAFAIAPLAQAQQSNAPIEFNYGYTTADHVNLYVAQDLNLFEKAGLKPKFFTFQSARRCSLR